MNIEQLQLEVTRLEEALEAARDALRRARIAAADERPETAGIMCRTVLQA